MNAAPVSAERCVEVVAGIDPRQCEAAWTLHRAWAAERGEKFDGEAWAADVAFKLGEGRWNVGIAWDGDKPVGVVEMHLEHDPMVGKVVAYGQRAYVLPEYRTADIFTAIFNFGMEASGALGITTRRAVAANDFYGQAMRRFYENRGFKVIGYVMEYH